MEKLFERIHQVEIFAMIELSEGLQLDNTKKNKFDLLEEKILEN